MIRRSDFQGDGEPLAANTTSRRRELAPLSPADATTHHPLGAPTDPIRSDEVYTLTEFGRRAKLNRNGLRQARKRGLLVRQCGRNKYVLGADWHAFLRQQPTSED